MKIVWEDIQLSFTAKSYGMVHGLQLDRFPTPENVRFIRDKLEPLFGEPRVFSGEPSGRRFEIEHGGRTFEVGTHRPENNEAPRWILSYRFHLRVFFSNDQDFVVCKMMAGDYTGELGSG